MLRGKIKEDHIPLNLAEIQVPGFPTLTAVTISGIEHTLETVDLPDRTKASGGQTTPVEFTIGIPMHHEVEQRALEIWFQESKEPVSPTYKKVATIRWPNLSGRKKKGYTLLGLFPSVRAMPDADMANEGELAIIEWTMNADDVLPIG